MKKVLIFILMMVLILPGCGKVEPATQIEPVTQAEPTVQDEPVVQDEPITQAEPSVQGDASLSSIPQNETLSVPSPDGQFRAEAYGTLTNITAGGQYPYEGIRVTKQDSNDVQWEMEPGGYSVSFLWSSDSRYVGIYYMARIYGESIVYDTQEKKAILLPKLSEIAPHYGESVKPQENRPDPYFKVSEWQDETTLVVDFSWTKADGDFYSGQFTFNVLTSEIFYQ